MEEAYCEKIAAASSIRPAQVKAVAGLLEEGATIPFIARYRKEATGGLDEVVITAIRDHLHRLEELDQRRASILKSLEERNVLTDELRTKVEAAETLSVLEDIYLPYRPKRRTRAMVAREKGLEPLAQQIFAQDLLPGEDDLSEAASRFLSEDKGVKSADEALAGARDIMGEWMNEDAGARERLRAFFEKKATARSRLVPGKETEGVKFRDYFDWEEPAPTAPSHRILAMRRGEKEKALVLAFLPPEEEALSLLAGLFVKSDNASGDQVRLAARDSYHRLLGPSLETELRLACKKRADEEATRVFAENLRQLLLAPPLGRKRVLAIDPGFRTGCKVVCLDEQGKMLHHDVILPHTGARDRERAARTIRDLCARFSIEAVAVGNGTAGRETEAFLRELDLGGAEGAVPVVMVNESGASVYSASEAAREEFPEHDVTVRGGVSIGRRLQDPLAELVKIDPKAIGVGQYQHDVDQKALRQALDDVVVSCVNAVGVEVNTASKQLLTYVSGLGPQLAQNLVGHRNAHGPFRSREELKEVSRLGPKAFEQSAGFLRIREGDNPLDASAVHPESYPVVAAMARDLGCREEDLMREPKRLEQVRPERYVTERAGLPTIRDILAELAKPGRDPRDFFEAFRFAEGVHTLEDLRPGMRLPGKVTNITRFGAFVDLGVHQDGLVHISQLADRFVKDPGEAVKIGQTVSVTVLEVDLERKRIALSMRAGLEKDLQRKEAGQGAGGRPENPRKGPAARRQETREGGKKKEELDPNNPFVQAFRKAKWTP
ncbi:MAG: Tex family protein [bacterium]